MSFWSIIERWYEKYWGKGISHIVMDRPPSTNEECRCPTKVFFHRGLLSCAWNPKFTPQAAFHHRTSSNQEVWPKMVGPPQILHFRIFHSKPSIGASPMETSIFPTIQLLGYPPFPGSPAPEALDQAWLVQAGSRWFRSWGGNACLRCAVGIKTWNIILRMCMDVDGCW